jgi:hypothetical protein
MHLAVSKISESRKKNMILTIYQAYDLIAQGQRFDLSSGCTLIGSPTATGATCIEITHSHAADFFVSKTVIVPTTGADSSLGIYPAPLPVTDTGNLSVPSTAIKSNPPVDTALRTGHESVAIASDPSPASNDPEINTATGSLVLATSGASASYLNATITAVSVGVPAANETLPVGTTGTMTVTMTVLASNIACHCACDSRSALSQSPMPSTSLVAKNYATKPTMPVAMVGGLVAGFMLLN